MVSSNFEVFAKFGLCSICSQNLNECLLAHACQIFALARMLSFFFKFPFVNLLFCTVGLSVLNSHKDKTKTIQGNLKVTSS